MKRKFRFPLRWVAYLLLLSLLATGVSLSRYRTEVSGSGSVSVARPAASLLMGQAKLNGVDADFSTALLLPGDVLVIPFEVRNFDASGRTQVRMEYQVSAVFDPVPSALPLTYQIVTVPSGAEYDSDGNGWNDLGFLSDITHGYELQMTWAEDDIDSKYMDRIQGVDIVLDARQVN